MVEGDHVGEDGLLIRLLHEDICRRREASREAWKLLPNETSLLPTPLPTIASAPKRGLTPSKGLHSKTSTSRKQLQEREAETAGHECLLSAGAEIAAHSEMEGGKAVLTLGATE